MTTYGLSNDFVKQAIIGKCRIITFQDQQGIAGLNNNGGSYDTGLTLLVDVHNKPLGYRYWSSWDGDFCPACGSYNDHHCYDCDDVSIHYHCNGSCPSGWENWNTCFDLETQQDIPAKWQEIDPDDTYWHFIKC